MRWLTIGLTFLLASCASNLTETEVAMRRQADMENWELCEKVYSMAHVYTIHVGHLHPPQYKPKWYEIHDDLSNNDCRRVLGDYWVSY